MIRPMRPISHFSRIVLSLIAVVVFLGLTSRGSAQTLNPTSLTFAPTTIAVASAAQSSTLTNSGTAVLDIGNISVSGANSGDFAYTTTCGATLQVAATCGISVIFTPSVAGTENAVITVLDDGTSSTSQTLTLSGIGVGVTLSPASLSFGSSLVGVPATGQTATLTNTATAPLVISGITFTGADPADFTETDNCGASLASNSSCTINVTFTPAAAGARAAALTVTDDDAQGIPGSQQITSLSGVGVAPASAATLSPTSLTFAGVNVGTTATTQSITLTNSGTATLNIAGFAISGANATDFAYTTTCSTTLAAATSCTISITFTPSAVGVRNASVTVTDDAGGVAGSQQAASLSGTGLATPIATVTPTALSFGAASSSQSITLDNTGTAILTITSVGISGPNASNFAIQTNTCGTTLTPGSSCAILIGYTASTSSTSATFTITDNSNNIGGSTQTVPLSGLSALSISTSSLPSGTINTAYSGSVVAVGGTSPYTWSIASGSLPTGITLDTTTGVISGTPTAVGSYTFGITVTDSSSSAQSATKTYTVVIAPPTLVVSTQTLPNGTIGAAYSTSVLASGGTTPYAWSVFSGSLPPGTSLNASSNPAAILISGTPTATGSYTFTLKVNDSSSPIEAATANYTIIISPAALTIVTPSLPGGSVNVSYSSGLSASGGTQPYTWSISSVAPQTLPPGLSINAGTGTITGSPTAAGSFTFTATVTDSGSPQQTANQSYTVVIGASNAALAPGSLTFANTAVGSSAAPQSLTLSNTGSVALSISNIAISGANAADFTSTNTCAGSVAAGGTCSISVTFAPSVAGAETATLTVTDNSGGNTGTQQTANLSGTGVAGSAMLSPASVSFGNSDIGVAAAPQSITLSNSGTATLSVSSIALSGANVADFTTSNNCNSSVTANGNCTITVGFTPSASGLRTATLTVTDNSGGPGNAQQTVSLSGTGVGVPNAVTGPSSEAFGNININATSAGKDVTLANNGTGPLVVSSIAFSGANPGDFSATNDCNGSLAAATSCTIVVKFTPTAAGPRSADLVISDNSGNNSASQQTVSLSGTGVAVPNVTLSTGSLSFGNTNTGVPTASQSVTVTNSGTGALTIAGIAISGGNSGDFAQTNNCGNSLGTGLSCAVTITFDPTAAGARSSSLVITDNANDTDGSTQTVSLSGSGNGVAQVTVAPASLAFQATTAPQQVTVSSTGTGPLTISSIGIGGANASAFSIAANSCPTGSLNAGSSCAILISYTATASNNSAVLTITDNANNTAGSTQTVTLTGQSALYIVTTSPLPNGQIGSAYSQPIAAQGGTAPYTWAVPSSNNLPPGLTLNTTTGVIAGTPTTSGTYSFSVQVSDSSSPQQTVSGQYSVTIVGPSASLAPSSLTFGTVSVGTTTASQSATLSNSGAVALTISSIVVSGTNASDFNSSNTCNGSVAANSNCTISITFTPSASGARTATLTVTDNSGGTAGAQQTVSLSGAGGSPNASANPASIAFGNVNLNAASGGQNITLDNNGTGTLTIAGIAVGGANVGDFSTTNNCNGSLAANTSCTIVVKFSPTAAGTRSATVVITDNSGNVAGSQQSVALSGAGIAVPTAAVSPLSVSFGSSNTGVTAASQSVTLTNSGTGALSISGVAISGGNSGDFAETNNCGSSLGAGLSCSVTLTFDPTAAGARSSSLVITDNANNSANSTQTVSLSGTGNGVAQVTVSPTSLSFQVGTPAQQVTVTSTGTGPLAISSVALSGANTSNFSIAANSCTSNSLNVGSSCAISIAYLPSASPNSALLTITDNANNAAGSTQTVTLSGQSAIAILTQSPLPSGQVSVAYSQSISMQGGTSPYTFSVIPASSSLPPGLSLGTSSGVISGTPTSAGAYSFSIKVNDSSSPQQSVTGNYTITIAPTNLVIQTSSLSNGTVGSTYSSTAVPSGGTTPYTWSVSSGNLPSGLSLNTGTGNISGTPQSYGSYTFTLKVTDSSSPAQTATQPYTVTIHAATLTLSSSSLPNGAVNLAYSASLTAAGGTLPLTWSISSGSLPAGLSLNSASGAITGTPTTAKSYTFTATVTDSASPAQTAGQSFTIIINSGIVITTSNPLPQATVEQSYTTTLVGQNGTAPYTWSLAFGTLPLGLTLNSSTGVISGTPPTVGSSTFTIKLADSGSPAQSTTQQFTLVVAPATLAITTTTLPSGTTSVAYVGTLAASGGTTPYTWSVSSGTLPAGTTLNASTGIISGNPTTPDTYTFTIKVTDSSSTSQTATQAFTVAIGTPSGGGVIQTISFSSNLSGDLTPGANVTSATVIVTPGGTYTIDLTSNFVASVSGLPSGYQGDSGFVSSTGTKSATASAAFTGTATSETVPSFDPGTVAGTATITATAQNSNVTGQTTITVLPQVPIIEPNSVQISNITSSGFDVELIATSTTMEVQSATFTFTPAAGATLSGTTTFTVDVKSLLSNWWFPSSGTGAGLTYGGAFSLTIPFTLSGSTSALGSVSVTLTNSVGTSAAVTGT